MYSLILEKKINKPWFGLLWEYQLLDLFCSIYINNYNKEKDYPQHESLDEKVSVIINTINKGSSHGNKLLLFLTSKEKVKA